MAKSSPTASPFAPSHSIDPARAPAAAAGACAAARARRTPPVKLVLRSPADDRVLEALAAVPPKLQGFALFAWLRCGWRLAQGRSDAPRVFMPPAQIPAARPGRELIRRVRYDDPGEPALGCLLAGLSGRERGCEIRRLVAIALREIRRTQFAPGPR
jgi:hypothetical protein